MEWVHVEWVRVEACGMGKGGHHVEWIWVDSTYTACGMGKGTNSRSEYNSELPLTN